MANINGIQVGKYFWILGGQLFGHENEFADDASETYGMHLLE